MGNSSSSNLPALKTISSCETSKFMGTWFVIAVKPTVFEKTNSNAVEKYTRVTGKSHDIDIDFQYNAQDPLTSKLKALPQKGFLQGNKEKTGDWLVSPFWPVKMTYPIIELDEKDYSYCVIGYPSRDYCWIMARKPVMDETVYNGLTEKLVEKHQYSLEGLRKVPQRWSKAEREKRGLTPAEIPDDLLDRDLN